MMPTHLYRQAIVTGASSGIGEAITRQLCEAGVDVTATSSSAARLSAAHRKLPKRPRKHHHPLVIDLRKTSDLSKLVRLAKKSSPDLLINNAGIGQNKSFAAHTDKDLEDIIRTNFIGHALLTKNILAAQPENTPLQIVFVTSLSGKIGFPGLSAYSASKFAIEGLCESLQQEHLGKNVSITVLRPGVTKTDFFRRAKMNETQRMHSPEAVAGQLIRQLPRKPRDIVLGMDRLFLHLLPFIPFNKRFSVLYAVNKLSRDRS